MPQQAIASGRRYTDADASLDAVRDYLEHMDGLDIHIEVELELNIQTVGPLVTVGGVTLIAPAMWALLAAQAAYGSPILPYVVSSYRSSAEQAVLYAAYLNGTGNLAAPPGSSNHETGTAVDITTSVANVVAPYMHRFGFVRDVPSESWHFHFTGFGN